ncbi:protein bric-a-brac 2-like isoform X2 [Belonocnema kinseyi]|uniref:protein bric-a-brac 2-like isoform X2 n=1 Tax=Belonocnema kinseyi TaxID=2817044 RepID=UPI00143D14D8|nr:protein bric-a-brac 2-like isoform X2 [Belonocnema kinseyi]
MGSSQQFSLRWNNYLKHITCAFDTLRTDEDLVDVTLSCEGKRIRAHKMLLSACSTYFRDLFKENPCQHPVVIFRNVKFDDLAALVDFMYQGEVNVVQEQLASFLTTAELLAVQGLTDGSGKDNDSVVEDDIEIPNEPEVQLQNASGRITTNSKGSKSPSSPVESQSQSEPPPTKKRKFRENSNANTEKAANAKEEKTENQKGSSDPVEIIPLMPNLKLEMPEYLEQDGSSCSYEESAGDSTKMGIDETTSETPDNEQKPDISQTFYSNQSASDSLDRKPDIRNLLSKPGTSGERSQESAQDLPGGGSGSTDPNTDFGFSNNDDFMQTSEAELLFRCRICWKGFKHPMSLTLHKNLHNGETVCPICQRVFSRSYDMKVHLQRIHKCTISVDAKLNFRK